MGVTRPLLAALLCALLTAPVAAAPVPGPARQGVGVGTSYGPGMMEKVIRVRLRQGYPMRTDLPHIALPDCGMIGKTVLIRARQTSRDRWSAWTRVQVADCSQSRDWGLHTLWGRRTWAELSYPLAKRWGVAGRFVVEVRW